MDDKLRGGWLSAPQEWDRLAVVLRKARVIGLDTEFYNVRVDEQSCVGRARVHVWSVAVRTAQLDPVGFRRCRSWVLPCEALQHPSLRDVLESPDVRKEIHNQPVDYHALANHGVTLRGGRNTLGLIRWKRPELINEPGRFKLKKLMWTLLGRNPVCTYAQLVEFIRFETVTKTVTKKRKGCSCGTKSCRKRAGHNRITWVEDVEVSRQKKVVDQYALESIVPGHERWDLLLQYAADDAVAALQIAEIADEAKDPAPWPYDYPDHGAGPAPPRGRPTFNQGIEDAVIAMEAVGIPVDTAWCSLTAMEALDDEETELQWLHRWYVMNAPEEGPHRREASPGKKNGVDAIWASPAKKLRLFDALGFPPSPIWKKGRVKKGKVKLDATALEWIGKNHKPAKQITEHLLNLGKIRGSKKYLLKLRDSGGMVHPICGPAGDDDDRAGAVTGRLGIKGEFEMQQIPSKEDKDPYQLRKAVVA